MRLNCLLAVGSQVFRSSTGWAVQVQAVVGFNEFGVQSLQGSNRRNWRWNLEVQFQCRSGLLPLREVPVLGGKSWQEFSRTRNFKFGGGRHDCTLVVRLARYLNSPHNGSRGLKRVCRGVWFRIRKERKRRDVLSTQFLRKNCPVLCRLTHRLRLSCRSQSL